MERVRIAFAGGRDLGVRVLEWLLRQPGFEVVAVCQVPSKYDPDYYDRMMKLIRDSGVYTCDIDGLLACNIDIGLSVNYHRIIGETVLNHCKKGFYNVHHSYNLRLRGRNITTHALLNTINENIYYHGTTLHLMVPELDAGGIVASEAIGIEDTDTALTLFNKTDKAAYKLITEWLPRIAYEKIFLYQPPNDGVHSYKNSELPSREINSSMTDETINAYIRAFDFPGKEPAFIMDGNRKIHLVTSERDEYKSKYELNGRTYFTD